MDETGDRLPSNVHFKRKKRSIDSAADINEEWASPTIHYQISAFGQNYHLNLTQESGFIAPLYTVTILGLPNSGNLTEFSQEGEEEEETDYQHCFYRGHVNADPEHTAVISLCSGLVSLDTTISKLIAYHEANEHMGTGSSVGSLQAFQWASQ